MDQTGPGEVGVRFRNFFGSFASSVKDQVLAPGHFYARLAVRRGDLLEAITFALTCGLVGVALAFGMFLAFPDLPGSFAPADPGFDRAGGLDGFGDAGLALALALTLVASIVGGIVGLIVGAVILHVLVVLVVGAVRGGFIESFRIVCYASVTSLLTWVPVAGYVVVLYGLVLVFFGVRSLHGASRTRALAVALVQLVFVAAAAAPDLLQASTEVFR